MAVYVASLTLSLERLHACARTCDRCATQTLLDLDSASVAPAGRTSLNLLIAPMQLAPGAVYVFRLDIAMQSPAGRGFAEIELTTNTVRTVSLHGAGRRRVRTYICADRSRAHGHALIALIDSRRLPGR